MKRILTILLMCAAAAACQIPFELDNVADPALCVQFIPHAGCSNGMTVSYAEPAFGTLSETPYPFETSDVSVLINGKKVSVSEDKENSSFNKHTLLLDAAPSPGDEVEVTVKGRGVPDAVARTAVPSQPSIASVSMVADTASLYTITLKLGNPVKDGEYYGLKACRRLTSVTVTGIGTPEEPIEETRDTVVTVSYFMPGRLASLSDLNSLDLDAYASVTYEGGFIVDASYSGEMMALLQRRHFDGGSYTFYANSYDSFSSGEFSPIIDIGDYDDPEPDETGPEDPDYPGDDWEIDFPDVPYYWDNLVLKEEYRFELFRLSEEFYNYAKAQYLCNYNMLSNFGVTPPNFTYTNVSGGLGVVAGVCSTSTDWITAPGAGN